MLKGDAAKLLAEVNLGSGVAENDDLLEAARVETSVFRDLLEDRVDLVPGTKGSGKTALYRIFVDFLPRHLLQNRRVVIAHGVQHRQDAVFLAHKQQFDKLNEEEFVDFWCVYLISLAYEKFIRSNVYKIHLKGCDAEIKKFRQYYHRAGIPDFEKKQTLKEILAWALEVVRHIKPSVTWTLPENAGQIEFAFKGGNRKDTHNKHGERATFPSRTHDTIGELENLLEKANLSLWLMIDQLDVIFARRSKTEKRALRGLLKALRLFSTARIRVKVFLRDDILNEISSPSGFSGLSHITARSSATLRWTEDQILTLITRRIFASPPLLVEFGVDKRLLLSSIAYQSTLFYKVFSDYVHRPPNQSQTLRWIYKHTKDGRDVVTPRDVIFLLTRACQHQRDAWAMDPDGQTDRLIVGSALTYGLDELSIQKRSVYLEAELPHKWPEIKKLVGGGTEYTETAMKRIFGQRYSDSIEDLISLGILERSTRKGASTLKIPFVYRKGLECTQRYVAS